MWHGSSDTSVSEVTRPGDVMFSCVCTGTNISEVRAASIFRIAGQ